MAEVQGLTAHKTSSWTLRVKSATTFLLKKDINIHYKDSAHLAAASTLRKLLTWHIAIIFRK